jgi:hypothetical protein
MGGEMDVKFEMLSPHNCAFKPLDFSELYTPQHRIRDILSEKNTVKIEE